MSESKYMPSGDDLLIIATVASTLFTVSEWGSNEHCLADIARQVAEYDVKSWGCCPICEEVACDDDCPLYIVRLHANMWQ